MQSSPLFPQFTETLLTLRQIGVLSDIPDTIDASNGFVCVACGDCDQRPDYMPWLADKLSQRWHPIFVNGGAASFPESSALHRAIDDDGVVHAQGAVYRLQAKGSFVLKGISEGIFMGHVPCGAAMSVGMNIRDLVNALVEATREFSTRYGDLRVKITPAIHVGWSTIAPESQKVARTYAIDLSAAERWLAENT